MCDGSRKDQAKCIDDLLPSELKNVSHSWVFFHFLKQSNVIFAMQIINSASVHWVKTLSIFNLSKTFFVWICFYFLFQRHSFIVFFEVAHINFLFQRHLFLLCSLKLHPSIFFFNDICFYCVLWSCPVIFTMLCVRTLHHSFQCHISCAIVSMKQIDKRGTLIFIILCYLHIVSCNNHCFCICYTSFFIDVKTVFSVATIVVFLL